MPDLSTIISLISIILTLGGLLGGVWAFRNSMTRTANEVQERVINALETELESLRQRIEDMKEENTRLRHIIDTICAALKSRGMLIKIDGDMITIHDNSSHSIISRIHEKHEPNP